MERETKTETTRQTHEDGPQTYAKANGMETRISTVNNMVEKQSFVHHTAEMPHTTILLKIAHKTNEAEDEGAAEAKAAAKAEERAEAGVDDTNEPLLKLT